VSLFLSVCVVVAVSFIIINWQDDLFPTFLSGVGFHFPWERSYSLEPGQDLEIGENLAVYAGFSPTAPEVSDSDIPLKLVESFAWENYTVKPGDSLSRIAVHYSISVDAIIASNTSISNERILKVGEKLKLPNMNGIPYTVKKGDNLSKIAGAMGIPLGAILDANDIQSEAIRPGTVLFIPGAKLRRNEVKPVLGGDQFIYPVRGRLTSPYGWRIDPINGLRLYHAALDLAANMGTPVKASMAGQVSMVGVNSVYGKYIILTHNNSYQTMYGHLSATSVKQGDHVVQGAKIGEVGNTGRSTGPHLHFALYKNGRVVNPLEFLKP
jgi:murein DD-endopeptidase MepM/ murein hydrolase activator NlpD